MAAPARRAATRGDPVAVREAPSPATASRVRAEKLPRHGRAAWLPMVVALGAAAGCTSSARREASSLAEAVEQYRLARDPATRATRQAAVGAVACSAERVCAAKAACVAALAPTTRALDLRDEVSQRVDQIEKGALSKDSPDALALPQKLEEAQHLLEDGRDKMRACDVALMALKTELGS